MKCPGCQSEVDPALMPYQELLSEYGRRRAAKRTAHNGGRPAVKKTCKKCGTVVIGAREFRAHKCLGNT